MEIEQRDHKIEKEDRRPTYGPLSIAYLLWWRAAPAREGTRPDGINIAVGVEPKQTVLLVFSSYEPSRAQEWHPQIDRPWTRLDDCALGVEDETQRLRQDGWMSFGGCGSVRLQRREANDALS